MAEYFLHAISNKRFIPVFLVWCCLLSVIAVRVGVETEKMIINVVKENIMTTKNETPNLVEMLGAEKVEELKGEVQKITNETYQPLLDLLAKKLHFTHTQAEVTSTVQLRLVEDASGQLTLTNDVALGLKFSPEYTKDAFEEANRLILTELFARTLQK
jgi:hypothetical protein